MDAFIAVTGRSETNILAAMLAKRMGVKKVIAEIENLDYINLAESIGIDTIINKKLVTASNIFRFTMSTDVQAIKCLTGSEAEVLEFIVKPNAPATKAPIKELKPAAGYDYRRRGARRQGFHRRGKHGVERLRSRGGFRYAGVDLQNWIFL